MNYNSWFEEMCRSRSHWIWVIVDLLLMEIQGLTSKVTIFEQTLTSIQFNSNNFLL